MNKLAFSNKDLAWADRITSQWRKTIESIFAVGDLLLEAKAELPHGQFEGMCRFKLPFGERTAEYLMSIASDKRLRKAKHASLLPIHWTTLNALRDLTNQEFDAAIEAKKINPEMTRADAEALAVRYNEVKAAEWAAQREAACIQVKLDTPPQKLIRAFPRVVEEEAADLSPIEQEPDEDIFQETLYEEACSSAEQMTEETRAKFFAHLREKYQT